MGRDAGPEAQGLLAPKKLDELGLQVLPVLLLLLGTVLLDSCLALPRPCPPSPSSVPQGSVVSERDYESLVMMRMRQAAERQQLIAQMQQEDKVGQLT